MLEGLIKAKTSITHTDCASTSQHVSPVVASTIAPIEDEKDDEEEGENEEGVEENE